MDTIKTLKTINLLVTPKRVERIIVRTSRKVRKEVSPLKLKRRLNKNSLKKRMLNFSQPYLPG